MKKGGLISLLACFAILIVFTGVRTDYRDVNNGTIQLTQWDGLGYYVYLPGFFIYDDLREYEWLESLDKKYGLSGGDLYQLPVQDNGYRVNKYLGGVAIMQSPLFAVGHTIARFSAYPADGFSAPYQYALAYGSIVYFFLALLLLRKILKRYFDDHTVGITLLLLCLASNLIQYVAVDSGLSHVYIFPLYVLILYYTIRWHETPKRRFAAAIGFIIGLAMICRPTEAIMLFIPLLWNHHDKESRKAKWQLIKTNKGHLIFVLIFGLLAICPQLLYWKHASGSWIFNVGSSWRFLTPYFRSLFGFEIGWFIYTPITILFVLGLFLKPRNPYRRSIIVFCLLNIWIIISWADWKYGATYSSRALVQSYPVFTFGLAASINWIKKYRVKWLFYVVGVFLVFVNLFQVGQYNSTILHYRDMNRQYYSAIYLNPNPSCFDMSLLDTDERITNILELRQINEYNITNKALTSDIGARTQLISGVIEQEEEWLRISGNLQFDVDRQPKLSCIFYQNGKWIKKRRIRLVSPISGPGSTNDYGFDIIVPNEADSFRVCLESYGRVMYGISELSVRSMN